MIKENKFLSLKDYEFSMEVDAATRAEAFQDYIHQMEQFETKPYWVMATSGVWAKMKLDGCDDTISAYISNDYLGMSQRRKPSKRELKPSASTAQEHVLPKSLVAILTSTKSLKGT